MCNTCQEKQDVNWVYEPRDSTYVLARCGIWEAQLAMEVYAKGQVMIVAKQGSKDVPAFLGEQCKDIPEPDNLMKLIQDVSKRMVHELECCQKVYLASLNESGKELHFWLIPRYERHKELLGIDGFALIADLRDAWVRREIRDKWDMPPKPEDGRKKLNDKWQKYADDYVKKFQG
jgi:hypothetical protein